ncbi:uncharacterized protein [Amphiura filiformis]|uniref:uncharacterized protein isoform X2 n=1 Tax=Amphiura filiformis TaxID=82378 RepID=UPI003B219462
MDYYSQNPAEVTSHRKTPPFSIDGILGLDQGCPVSSLTASSPLSILTTPPVAQVEIPAKSRRGGLRRRPRTVYTVEQMEALESVFAANQYPDINSREALADALDTTESRVQVWFQNRRARLRRQAKRKTSSSPSDTSSTESEHRQKESPPAAPEMTSHRLSPETPAITSHRRSPETAIMTSQRCREVCCSPPPICTSASFQSSCSSSLKFNSYPANLPSYGLPQQYGGAFPCAYYPHQYAYYYRPSAYTTVSSAYQGIPICSVPKCPPVARVEPVTNHYGPQWPHPNGIVQ